MSNRRKIDAISNDFSEGMPLTESELVRLVAYERRNYQELLNKHNQLKDKITTLVAESLVQLHKS